MSVVKSEVTSTALQEALITSSDEVRLTFALRLAKWYCDERDRADYYRAQSERWHSIACVWMGIALLDTIAVLLLCF